ncbi:MAG TPA: GDSL-type esterase/lipase family protein [Acidimicrobiales bacterium]|nr:GDSL-type esterase/lipase family protein [Acidimicrobiales bacterium]
MAAGTGAQQVSRARRVGTAIAAALLVASGSLVALSPTGGAATPTRTSALSYQLSLGDSLAAGTGASVPANNYVNLIAAHEAAHFPGLQVENLACGGATTNSMIDAADPQNSHCQTYTGGTQLSGAEAFLRAHTGQVPYVTIDIGGNNVDGCLNGSIVNLGCITMGLSLITSQLPVIVQGLQAAAPGVPIFGMDYYNPFLAIWVLGGASGPALATESAALSSILNGSLVNTYGANHAVPVDVQGAFATQDFAMTGTWNGVIVPQNVARTCEWTHMCDSSGLTIHTNDIGHAKLAGAFDQQIDRWRRGGGRGAWLADAVGGIHLVGNATSYGSMAGQHLNAPIVGIAATPTGQGYWMVAADGGVFAFGDAGFHGSTGGLRLNAPIVGIAATATGQGYWLVAADGGVFAFGDATFLGSMGGTHLNQPVVGMAQTGSDQGYWLVAADGGVFTFGDAGFKGSAGGTTLNQAVVGMSATVDGNGYWLVAADGGAFSYGDAVFHGSTGSLVLNRPVVGMTLPPDGFGYTMGASDGGLFAFGNAIFNGSLAGSPPADPIVAVVGT